MFFEFCFGLAGLLVFVFYEHIFVKDMIFSDSHYIEWKHALHLF